MRTAIFYLTYDGQTQKIAEYIASHLENVELFCLRDHINMSSNQLAEFDRIVIGASIRYGHFSPVLAQFISMHSALLNQRHSAFFSVNLTARKANRNTPTTNIYTRKLLEKIDWKPNWVEVFAGALRYPRYRWFDRLIIRFIMKMTGGETDTRQEYEYTDWTQVREFALKIGKLS
ncbi:MAG: menaquinone-dependent protoporphyrinogen IX dehydrogenase [Pasteurellaceae bacterium]|nr:menaquinone-dependent protoporphyrinogen IX dehydrogenase [Pasteurellaceae bacterium]